MSTAQIGASSMLAAVTGNGSMRGGNHLPAQQPPEWGKGLPLRQAHLILSLPPVHLQIDNRSPSGPWKHRKPGERDQSSHPYCYDLDPVFHFSHD